MTAIAAAAPHFGMNAVVSRMFGAVKRNLAVFAALAILFVGIPSALNQWAQLQQAKDGASDANAGAMFALMLAGWVASFIGTYVLQAAVVHGTVADLNGRRASLGECVRTGFRNFWVLVGISIVTGVLGGLGLLLLIVPGVILLLRWSVSVAVAVVERRGVSDSMRRSAELTRGHRGAILVLWLIYVLLFGLSALIAGVIVAVGMALQGDHAILQSVGISIVQTVLALFGAAGAASIYYELRAIKEGIGPEALAAVFD